MESGSAREWLKLLQEAKKGTNPYLLDMCKLPNLDAIIAHFQTDLDALKAKGFAPLSIFDRFKRAGQENEYRSIYNLLSTNTHSNISALIDRHIEIENDDFMVVYYKDEPLERYVLYVAPAARVLSDTSECIHEFFCTGQVAVFQQLSSELVHIRGRYPAQPNLPLNLDLPSSIGSVI